MGFLFTFLSDEEELRKSFSELGEHREDTHSRGMKCTGSGIEPASGALLYKKGCLIRKVHADCDGKRSTFHYSLLLLIQYLGKCIRNYGATQY